MTGEKNFACIVDNPLLVNGDELVCVDYSQIDDVDCLRVCADIELGTQYDSIELDDEVIIERMRSEGMTSSQIAQIAIKLSAEIFINGEMTVRGWYSLANNQVVLYPNGVVYTYVPSMVEVLRDDPTVYGRRIINAPEVLSAELSTVTYHELRHARQRLVEKTLQPTGKNPLSASTEDYLADSFEVDARIAGEEAPSDVVRVQPKQSTISIYRTDLIDA